MTIKEVTITDTEAGRKQEKFVAVRPNGTVCGPMGETFDEVKIALQVGHQRAGGSGEWLEILRQGYSVRRARIELLDH